MLVPKATLLVALILFTSLASAADELRGRSIAAACYGCHGPGAASGAAIPPILQGAPKEYIMNILMAFRDGSRSGTIMNRIAKGYTDADIAAVAEHFSRQGGM